MVVTLLIKGSVKIYWWVLGLEGGIKKAERYMLSPRFS